MNIFSDIGAGHLDASRNEEWARILGINDTPSLIAVINRTIFHYDGEFRLKPMREFVRKIFPSNLLIEVS